MGPEGIRLGPKAEESEPCGRNSRAGVGMSKTGGGVRLPYPDLFTQYLIELRHEGSPHPEWSPTELALMCGVS